jgi:hypothetical protein
MKLRGGRAIALALVSVVGCGGVGNDAARATTTARATTSSTTTTATTVATTAPPTTLAAGSALGADEATLAPPEDGTPARTATTDVACPAPAAEGFTIVTCAVGGSSVGLVEKQGDTGGLIAWVLHRNGSTLTPALVAPDPDASLWSSVTLLPADLDGDGAKELIFGFRSLGSGGLLSVDVVSSDAVKAHLGDLPQGAATVAPGALETWSAVSAADDPVCCPSSLQHLVIHGRRGAYTVAKDEHVAPGSAPKSQL